MDCNKEKFAENRTLLEQRLLVLILFQEQSELSYHRTNQATGFNNGIPAKSATLQVIQHQERQSMRDEMRSLRIQICEAQRNLIAFNRVTNFIYTGEVIIGWYDRLFPNVDDYQPHRTLNIHSLRSIPTAFTNETNEVVENNQNQSSMDIEVDSDAGTTEPYCHSGDDSTSSCPSLYLSSSEEDDEEENDEEEQRTTENFDVIESISSCSPIRADKYKMECCEDDNDDDIVNVENEEFARFPSNVTIKKEKENEVKVKVEVEVEVEDDEDSVFPTTTQSITLEHLSSVVDTYFPESAAKRVIKRDLFELKNKKDE